MNIKCMKMEYVCLKSFIKSCENQLLKTDPIEFLYPNNQFPENKIERKDIEEKNNDLLTSLNNNANLYAIYKKENNKNNWKIIYVGQRESKYIKIRIKEHLIKKSKDTNSKIEDIKHIINNKGKIALSFIKIEPESLRLFIENEIISRNKKDLILNIRK